MLTDASAVQFGGGKTPQSSTSAGFGAPSPTSSFDFYASLNPQFAASGNQMNQIGATLPVTNAYYDARSGYLGDNARLAQQQNALQMKGFGVDRQGLGRDAVYYNARLALNNSTLANQQAQLGTARDTAIQTNDSNQTAGGSWFAPGHGIINQRAVTAYDQQLQQAQLAKQGQDLSDQRSLDKTSESLAKLGISEQSTGLNSQQIRQQLEQGLQQLGYDRFTNIGSLMDALNSANATHAAAAAQALQDALKSSQGGVGDQYAGYTPTYRSNQGAS